MDEIKEPSDDFPRTFSFGAACASCKTSLPPLRDTAAVFFENGSVPCSNCKVAVDLWDVTKKEFEMFRGTFIGLVGLGANQTVFIFDLQPGKIKILTSLRVVSRRLHWLFPLTTLPKEPDAFRLSFTATRPGP